MVIALAIHLPANLRGRSKVLLDRKKTIEKSIKPRDIFISIHGNVYAVLLGFSILWEDTISIYTGGCLVLCGIPSVLWKIYSTVEGYHLYLSICFTALMVSPHSTEHLPEYCTLVLQVVRYCRTKV